MTNPRLPPLAHRLLDDSTFDVAAIARPENLILDAWGAPTSSTRVRGGSTIHHWGGSVQLMIHQNAIVQLVVTWIPPLVPTQPRLKMAYEECGLIRPTDLSLTASPVPLLCFDDQVVIELNQLQFVFDAATGQIWKMILG